MSLPGVKTYIDSTRAPNPRRVKIFMAEKGVEFPIEDVSIMQGEHRARSYLDRVGAPVVPALELDDGTVLTESMSICLYLEGLYPEPNLMGVDALERARIDMWSRRVEFGVMFPVAMVLRHGNPAMAALEDQVPEWAEANRGRVLKGLKWLDRVLGKQAFVAGPRYTIADITALVAIDFMRAIKTPVPEEMVHLLAWREGLNARPSTAVK